jgi:hypothetical protein
MKNKKYQKIEKLFKKKKLLAFIENQIENWVKEKEGIDFEIVFRKKGEDELIKTLYNNFLEAVSGDLEKGKNIMGVSYGLNYNLNITNNKKIKKIKFPEIVIFIDDFLKVAKNN